MKATLRHAVSTCVLAGSLALALALAAGVGSATEAKSLVVGPGESIQKAINSAHSGDVIRIGPGTYAGGVTIDKSVNVIGSGAGKTIIKGGGPVLTIGKAFARSEPKVTISKVKITGGRTTSSPISNFYVGKKDVIALGGGIAIPPGKFFRDHITPGATVRVTDSVITNNRVGPTATVPLGPPCPGGRNCPFAYAGGGGIDNWGALTLERTEVNHNLAAGVASDATGGGIDSPQGSLNLLKSTITSNRAIASVPNGRFAEGGGIFAGGGELAFDSPVAVRIRGGSISHNEASLTSNLPYFVGDADGDTIGMSANGGGARLLGGGSISISHVRLNENKLSVDTPNGEPNAFDAALSVGGDAKLDLSHSKIEDNRVRARIGTSEDVGGSGGAFGIDSPPRSGHAQIVSHVRFTGNTTLVTSEHGVALASPGAIENGNKTLITHSVISGNRVEARSAHGSADVTGAGLSSYDGRLMLQHDLIKGNHGVATGPDGFARGGGIWSVSHLRLEYTSVIGNTLRASPGLPVKGGGIFTTVPVRLEHSRIAHNVPDQCFGCR
jgi:hypothetical protein